MTKPNLKFQSEPEYQDIAVFAANTSWYLINFRQHTIKHFINSGVEVWCFAPDRKHIKELSRLGAKVHSPPSWLKVKIFALLWLAYQISRCLCAHKPTAIFSFTPLMHAVVYLALTVTRYKGRVYPTISGRGRESKFGALVKRLFLIVQRRMCLVAKVVIFQNRADLEIFVNQGIILRDKALLVPGSGVDVSHFSAPQRIHGELVNVVLVSRPIKEKGVDDYISAARLLAGDQRFEFHLIGALIDVQHEPQKITDNLWAHPFASDIVPHLHSADVICLPTYYNEGVPKSLLEGLACGLAVVATDRPGVAEIVEPGGNGFFCKPRDPVSIADALLTYAALSRNEKKSMAALSRKLAEDKFNVRDNTFVYYKLMWGGQP